MNILKKKFFLNFGKSFSKKIFLSRPGPTKFLAVTARPGLAQLISWAVTARAGPVMLNFISIRIFRGFYKENLNFIINSFQIKCCSFKKNGEYSRNLRGILAKNGPARPEEILSPNGPAKIRARPARPGLVHLNLRAGTARPDLSSLKFTTLIRTILKMLVF